MSFRSVLCDIPSTVCSWRFGFGSMWPCGRACSYPMNNEMGHMNHRLFSTPLPPLPFTASVGPWRGGGINAGKDEVLPRPSVFGIFLFSSLGRKTLWRSSCCSCLLINQHCPKCSVHSPPFTTTWYSCIHPVVALISLHSGDNIQVVRATHCLHRNEANSYGRTQAE